MNNFLDKVSYFPQGESICLRVKYVSFAAIRLVEPDRRAKANYHCRSSAPRGQNDQAGLFLAANPGASPPGPGLPPGRSRPDNGWQPFCDPPDLRVPARHGIEFQH